MRGTKPNLAALVAKWQHALRLRDWRIDVAYVPRLKGPSGGAVYGLCDPHVDARTARIWINDPSSPWGRDDPSVEETLIHELLHLHFAPLAGSTQAEIVAEEQAVWAITEAIAPRPMERTIR